MYYYNLAESGKRLRELRIKKGNVYTQEKVAEDIGISREYLNRIETGKKGCSVEMLLIFAQYYGVTMDYITYGREEIKHVAGLLEKMDRLTEERRILAGKLIDGILDNLL